MEVLSKETIKPTSSTPPHLQKLNLSLLDQIAPPTYVHLLFFYQCSSPELDHSQLSLNLKNSLSHVLTTFYPLAGRIIPHDSCIDCNDHGVEYAEFRVHACMSDIIYNDPQPAELQKYVPMEPYGLLESHACGEVIPLAVQVNLFDCGGIAVGVCISHKIADTESLVMFMNAWATTCRKGCLQASSIHPCFDLTCRFPPLDPLTFSSKPQAPPHSEDIGKVVTKRFVFNKEVLSKLKKLGASAEVTNPTRIEAITAFLWRNLMIAFRQDAKRERKEIIFVACHAVNVRSRLSPPLPAHSFGNGTLSATAWSSKKPDNKDEDEDEHDSYAVLVAKLRNAIRGINHDYVEKMLDGERNGCMENPCGDQVDNDVWLEVYIFSSWCRFGVYGVDYGWGKPVWVSTVGVPFKNVTVFMDTRCGDGIEAWVSVAEEDMSVIETNYKLLQLPLI
ncbi:UNVERIFIED_CONTAM: Stemmadenine O-acetyltransferase [Sesamum radiatum]|uniref:Stemmadenine O-acetyltransferase n=1 Tax=Sesamum radiatum TaxID=300843 RepID=A0AAW2WMV7_SESRA